MFSLLNNPLVRVLAVCLVAVLLFAPAYHEVQAGANPLVTLVVAVLTGTIGLIIYDLVSCDLNILFGGCGGGGGSGTGNNGNGNGDGSGGAGDGTGNGSGGGNGNGSGGGLPVACSTAPITNACGMPGVGFVENGVCNATPPANSACPLPTIGDVGFYADPPRVRAGNRTTLHWDVTNATLCSLTGGGLSLSSLGIVGSTETLEVNAATAYTLTCWNGIDGPQNSEEAVVTIVPSFEEI